MALSCFSPAGAWNGASDDFGQGVGASVVKAVRPARAATAWLASALVIGTVCLTLGGGPARAASSPSDGVPVNTSPPSGHGDSPLTAARLARYLRAAASITVAPADLTPALDNPHAWGPIIVENGCQLSPIDLVVSLPCVYGDPDSPTSVVLFGDSHAGAWFPALEQISIERHWRLLIFTKAGCSPPEVKLYSDCQVWRTNTEAQIAAIHPAIVFVSWARWIEGKAKALAGVPTGWGGAWQDGVAAIFNFLRQSAGRVIFISDVPTFTFGGARCISRHLKDVQPCNETPLRTAIVLPTIRSAEFQLAKFMGVDAIDPIPWLCTTVCPVLVRNMLVYWDSAHMTAAWSTFIAPVLNTAITAILAQSPQTGAVGPFIRTA